MRHSRVHTASFFIATACLGGVALAQPSVPGVPTALYAEFGTLYHPYAMSFDTAGFLYAGSDNNDNNGVLVKRVQPGGGTPVPISPNLIYDPDGVMVDRTGGFSGVPGAVLIASSSFQGSAGLIWAVRPDGTVFEVVPATSVLNNNDCMAFDSAGRLFVAVNPNRTVVRFNGTTPEVFATMPPGISVGFIAVDGLDRLWAACTDGALRRFGTDGSLQATIPVGGTYPALAFSPGGQFARGVYTVNLATGVLSRVSPADTLEPVGTSFTTHSYSIAFDASGGLISADWDTGQVWRIGCGGSCCDSIDFNHDDLFPDTQDITDFLLVFAGGDCPTATCGDIDFNNDGLFPDTLDIDSLLSVFSGGACV